MKIEPFEIDGIPAILYGEPSKQGYLFFHGQMGCKEEAEAFARAVCPKGLQVLSIDLPGHGARRDRGEELTPWTAVPDIRAAPGLGRGTLDGGIRSGKQHRRLLCHACHRRAGPRFAGLPYSGHGEIDPDHDGMGRSNGRTAATTGEIPTDFGQTLSWNYLCWVREHPVNDWECPVRILYGSMDTMTPRTVVEEYAEKQNVRLTVMNGGEHWFHTPEQLAVLQKWEETEL